METIKLSAQELNSIAESGTILKMQKASAIPAGVYSVIEISNFSLQSREDIIEILSKKGKDTEWCSTLPETNIKGIIALEKNGSTQTFYLNNQLFNLLVEQNVFNIVDVKEKGKVVSQSFELTENQLKIS